jgi:hypothetical protein
VHSFATGDTTETSKLARLHYRVTTIHLGDNLELSAESVMNLSDVISLSVIRGEFPYCRIKCLVLRHEK